MKAVVIDDEPAHVHGILKYIKWEELGFDEPTGFTDVKKALRYFEENAADVVITDIRMPEIDGLTLIRKFQDIKSDLDIIIVSGYDNFSYAQEAIKLGVRAYLLKPLKIEELHRELVKCQDNRINNELSAIKKIKSENQEEANTELHPSIRKIIEYIHLNYASGELTMQLLAERFQMNDCYLSSLFHKETGVNLNSYITIFRLKKGMQLLKSTQDRISEISYRCGYNNPSYFSEQFKNYFGITPSEARKSNETA